MSTEATPLLSGDGGGAAPPAATPPAVAPPGRPDAPTWPQVWGVIRPLIWPASRTQAALMGVALVAIVVEKAMHVLPPLAMKYAVDAIAYNASVSAGEAVSPYAFVLAYFALETGAMFLATVRLSIQNIVQADLDRRVSVHMFAHLHSLSLQYHLEKQSGTVIRVMDRGVDAVGTLVHVLAYEVVPTLIETCIVSAVFIKLGSTWVALSTFISVAAYAAYGLLLTGVRVKLLRENNDAWEAVGNRQVQSLGNFETVKSFGKTEDEVSTYEALRKTSQEVNVKMNIKLSFLYYIQNLIYSVGKNTGLLICAVLTVFGSPRLTPGDFVLISMYIGQLFFPLIYISYMYRDVTDALTDVEKAVAILLKKPEIEDAPGAQDITQSENQSGDVIFDNVSFHYKVPDADIVDWNSSDDESDSDGSSESSTIGSSIVRPKSLEADPKPSGGVSNISFHIRPGKTLALCGKSGSGKSTITRLLLRLYEADDGRILVNGLNIRTQVTQFSLRSIVGIVSQEVVLFNDTLRTNIRYGRPLASDPECRAAMEAAAMGPFLNETEEGLDTVVGERGLRLSGGERQRVGNARILLKEPQIMVLDEATSALDSRTEKKLQSEVRERCANRTTLVIAHRLSTIVHADEIILLDKGMIKERGTHSQLLCLDGEYARMWKHQTSAGPAEATSLSSADRDGASS